MICLSLQLFKGCFLQVLLGLFLIEKKIKKKKKYFVPLNKKSFKKSSKKITSKSNEKSYS